MPAYMINTFLGIFEVQTQKDLLEAKMGIEQNAVNQNARMLIAHWYADNTGADLDSIPALLDELNTPYSKMYKAAYLYGMGNKGQADEVLGEIGTNFELSVAQSSLLNSIVGFNTTRNSIATDSAMFNLDAGKQTTLENLAANSLTKVGKYAKAWLKYTANELYWPFVPEGSESSNKREKRNIFEKREVEENTHLLVYPNPATDFITIERKEVSKTNVLTVQLINSSGNTVISKTISESGLLNISTSNLPSGIYILRVLDQDQEVQTQTIEIIH